MQIKFKCVQSSSFSMQLHKLFNLYSYRIYLNKRRSTYELLIFNALSATLIRGRYLLTKLTNFFCYILVSYLICTVDTKIGRIVFDVTV